MHLCKENTSSYITLEKNTYAVIFKYCNFIACSTVPMVLPPNFPPIPPLPSDLPKIMKQNA